MRSSAARWLRLALAVLFLTASLAAAGLMVRGALVAARDAALPPSPSPAPTATVPPPTATATTSPTVTATPAPTPTPAPAGVHVVVVREGDSLDPAAFERSVETLSTALADARLPDPVNLSVADEAPPTADLVARWQAQDDGSAAVSLSAALQPPPLPRVEAQPEPWQVTAPGGYPILVDDDPAFAAGIVVALLEAAHGAPEDASARIDALRATLHNAPRALAANHTAHVEFAKGRAAEAGGLPLAAFRWYSEAIRRGGPDFAAAHLARGGIYYRLGDAEAALRAYEAAQAPTESELALAYNRALAYQLGGDARAAAAEAARTGMLGGEPALAANLLGWLAYERADFGAARRAFAEAAGLAPDEPAPLYNLAQTLHAMADYEEAAAAYARLVGRFPQADFLTYQGQNFEALGQPQAALDAYDRALRTDDTHTAAHLARGWLRLELENAGGAVRDADRAVELAPDAADGYSLRGLARLAVEDYTGAEEALSQALALGDERAAIYAARAWARQVRGYRLGAVSDYRTAVERGLEDGEMFKRAGFLHFTLGRYADSLEMFAEAAMRLPDNPDAQAGLALALDTDFQREAAAAQYQRALALDERYARADFLAAQPLWSELAVNRAVSILRWLGVDPYE